MSFKDPTKLYLPRRMRATNHVNSSQSRAWPQRMVPWAMELCYATSGGFLQRKFDLLRRNNCGAVMASDLAQVVSDLFGLTEVQRLCLVLDSCWQCHEAL